MNLPLVEDKKYHSMTELFKFTFFMEHIDNLYLDSL